LEAEVTDEDFELLYALLGEQAFDVVASVRGRSKDCGPLHVAVNAQCREDGHEWFALYFSGFVGR
jgi:hypothetical protein